MLLRGARRHVMGQEVRDATHEADPDEDRGEPTAGSTRRARIVSPPAAVTIPPIQATNVPSIHHTGRYHQVLPPPIASHVQGYALKGRNRTMSMALNTTVPTRPKAAAPAMPSVL